MIRLAGALAALLLAGCAVRPPSPDAFSFAVLGDAPYTRREEAPYLEVLRRLDHEPIAFVIHVGDTKSSGEPCTDAFYEKRRAEFDNSRHPFIYTPGDNEWVDCRRDRAPPHDPLERLARIRQVYFAEPRSLGRERIATEMQSEAAAGCTAYPENRAWAWAGVRFVTLNIPGSDNNVGFDAESDAEALCRNEANRRWLERAVAASESPQVRALVVAIQANPWASKKGAHDAFRAQLHAAALRLAKPLLFVHGDTHIYRVDAPFTDAFGEPVPNLTRLETYGSPFIGWVRVTVEPTQARLFTYEPMLQAVPALHP